MKDIYAWISLFVQNHMNNVSAKVITLTQKKSKKPDGIDNVFKMVITSLIMVFTKYDNIPEIIINI